MLCNVCNLNNFEDCEVIKLQCGHTFNWKCIEAHLKIYLKSTKVCPVSGCNKLILDSEIRQVLSVNDVMEYEQACLKEEQSIEAASNRDAIAKVASSPLLQNTEIFICETCTREICKGQGIMLRNCFDNICRDCLCGYVKDCQKIPTPCPFLSCKAIMDDRECREILPPEEGKFYERRCLSQAIPRGSNAKTAHCRKPDCSYLCDIDSNVKTWTCTSCRSVNCVSCDAIHPNMSCSEHKALMAEIKNTKMIEEQIRTKQLMRCPDCKRLIRKDRGCNWIPCPGCGVELCWITQQYRWGKNGPGDTSGGCRCDVNGRCAPGCEGCGADIGRRHPRYANINHPPPPQPYSPSPQRYFPPPQRYSPPPQRYSPPQQSNESSCHII